MAKRTFTCQDIMDYLKGLQSEGYELSKIEVNYRHDYDSDVRKVSVIEEDLYDSKTNSKLASVIFLTKS